MGDPQGHTGADFRSRFRTQAGVRRASPEVSRLRLQGIGRIPSRPHPFRRRPSGTRASLAAILLGGVLAWTAGCDQTGLDLGSVEGVITLDGQPLAGALVEFQPVGGERSSYEGQTDPKGHYVLHATASQKGAELGEYTVHIRLPKTGTDPSPKPPVRIPARYNTRTELKATVQAGKNKCDFALTSK